MSKFSPEATEAVKELVQAFFKVSALWEEEGANFNETLTGIYPFDESFDEVALEVSTFFEPVLFPEQAEATDSEVEVVDGMAMVKDYEVYGCWTSPESGTQCRCGEVLKEVPEEGHYNSQYWRLKRNDGMVLKCCPKGCKN